MAARSRRRPRRPGRLRAPAAPPWARAITSTIARPSPAPPRPRAGSPRVKRSNAASRNSGGKPGPSSRTCSSTRPFDALGRELDVRRRRGAARCRRGCRAPARSRSRVGAHGRGPSGALDRARPEPLRDGSSTPRVERRRPDRQPRPPRRARARAGPRPAARAGRSPRRPSAARPRAPRGCGPRAAPARARPSGSPAACAARGWRRRRTRARARYASSSRASISLSVVAEPADLVVARG